MFEYNTLAGLLDYIDKGIDNSSLLNYLEEGKWQSISSKDFVSRVRRLAAALQNRGVGQGTCVAIISDSSPFWLIMDFALQSLGAVSVPIFANISSENLNYELEDAEIRYAYIASQEKFDQLEPYFSDMELVLIKDVKAEGPNIELFDTFFSEENDFEKPEISPEDLATIIYTSGSTGQPKGVELSHENLITQIKDTQLSFNIEPGYKALSFLPLAHIFERMVMSYYLSMGISVYFADDVKNVGELLKEVKPQVMTVVPRLLDKIYTKMHENIATSSGVKKLIGSLAFYRANNKDPNAGKSFFFDEIFSALVYSKLSAALGGELRYLITGGAPLSLPVYRFFHNIGIPLFQGYGLTETSPVISVNTETDNKVGTCGKPFAHVEVKLGDDSELLMRGKSMMRGYHKQKGMTDEVIDTDGWLHTGDLAEIDEEGFIIIKSRKKELFKTSTGKYVSAIAIEQMVTANKWIDYAVVIADNRPFVSTLIFMDEILLEAFAKEKKLDQMSFEDLVQHRRIQSIVMNIIKKVNEQLNSWERIQKFYVVGAQVSIESGVLTPSMKVSRQKVEELYQEEIESFYRS